MVEPTTLILAGVAWVAFWYGIPMVVAFWELNHNEDASIVTGEPLVHPRAASQR